MTGRWIGRLVLLVALAACFPAARAAEVVVTWEPVSRDVEGGPETISHYLLHLGRSPRPADVVHPGDGTFRYEQVINAGENTEHRFEDLEPATWFFAVSAVDTEGNLSNYSTEYRLGVPDEHGQVPPPKPTPKRSDRQQATPPKNGGCATTGGPMGWAGLLGLLIGIARRRYRFGRNVGRAGAAAIGQVRQV